MITIKQKIQYFFDHKNTSIFILFALVISVGALVLYNHFSGVENRLEKEKTFQIQKEAVVIKLVRVQHLSMDFDGNQVLTIAFRISYEYQINDQIIESTDIVEKGQIKLANWYQLKNLKVGDIIKVRVNQKNIKESIVDFKSN